MKPPKELELLSCQECEATDYFTGYFRSWNGRVVCQTCCENMSQLEYKAMLKKLSVVV